MKKTSILYFLGLSITAIAQNNDYRGRVGINTEQPKATLQIKSIDSDVAKGILTPQVTGEQLTTMTEKLTEEENGLLVYTTSPVRALDYNHYTPSGYYRFNHDGTSKSWVNMEPTGLEKINPTTRGARWRLIPLEDAKQYHGLPGILAMDLTTQRQVLKTDGKVRGATGTRSIAIGVQAEASTYDAIAIGSGSSATGRSIALGYLTQAEKTGSVAIGGGTQATGEYSLAMIGGKAQGERSIAIGDLAIANGRRSMSLGSARTNNNDEVAFGPNFSTDTDVESPTPSSLDPTYYTRQIFSVGGKSRTNAIIILRNGYTGISLPSDTNTPANSKPTEMLDVNGDIRVRGNQTTTFTGVGGNCTNLGTITFQNDNFYGCKSSGWVLLNN